MTDNRVTQVSIEEFATANPRGQATQVTIEQWATTATITGQAIVTQVALEQWAQIVPTLLPGGAQARVMVMA
jgi:ABC-type polar amino acid transport system ATPase subunit